MPNIGPNRLEHGPHWPDIAPRNNFSAASGQLRGNSGQLWRWPGLPEQLSAACGEQLLGSCLVTAIFGLSPPSQPKSAELDGNSRTWRSDSAHLRVCLFRLLWSASSRAGGQRAPKGGPRPPFGIPPSSNLPNPPVGVAPAAKQDLGCVCGGSGLARCSGQLHSHAARALARNCFATSRPRVYQRRVGVRASLASRRRSCTDACGRLRMLGGVCALQAHVPALPVVEVSSPSWHTSMLPRVRVLRGAMC